MNSNYKQKVDNSIHKMLEATIFFLFKNWTIIIMNEWMKKIKWVEWKLKVVEENEPEAMKEVKLLLEIKPLIAIGAMLIMKLRTEKWEWPYHMLEYILTNIIQFQIIMHGILFLCLCFLSQIISKV